MRVFMMRSTNFPNGIQLFSRQIGLYDLGLSNGLSPLRSSTSFAIFHSFGNVLSLRHALNMSLSISGLMIDICLITKSGTPSGPVALPLGIFRPASITYALVVSGNTVPAGVVGHIIFATWGNNVSTIDSSLPGR